MAETKRQAVMRRVVQAAVDCIEEYGIQKATIRAIAAKADMNSAAVNYYFSSKDELIRLALERALDDAFDISNLDVDDRDTPAQVLERLFAHWLKGVGEYPGIIRAYFYEPFVHQDYGDPGIARLREFINEVEKLMVRHGMARSRDNTMKVRWAFCAFLCNILMPGLFGDDVVASEETGRRFIKLHYALFSG